MADRNLIDPDVTEMAPCARCGELVRLSRTHCPACGVAIDPEELYPAAMEYARAASRRWRPIFS
ncbi:MAG: hypothetical protein ACKV2V_02880 [Blastocatellia bacterium]